MATIKKKTITTSDGRTHVVKVGSKADTKYSSQSGSTSSSSASSIAKAENDIKARTSARSSSNTDAYGVSLDIANAPGTINSSTLAPATQIALPPAPVPSNLGTNALTTLTGLAGPAQEQANAALTTAQKSETASMDQSFKDYIKSLSAPKSTEDIYKKTEREVGLVDKQQKVANLANQLQAITDKATADKLSLVGQGRGVTETIIGGQQAKIDREAAIQSLPIATQLAAAQGDLELAQSHLDTLFRIRADDAQRQYEYKTKVAEAVYNYASEKQKILLDDRRIQDERNFTLLRDRINQANDLASTALKNGQSYIYSQLMSLDPNSPTYAQDIARIGAGVRLPQGGTSIGALTTTDEQYLLTVGFTGSEIKSIQDQIPVYGIDAVLANVTGPNADAQKAAIRKVYGGAAESGEQFLDKNYFKSIFTDSQLKQSASDSGFRHLLTSWSTEKNNYLDYLVGIVDQYRRAGYSDKEILKMMQ